MVRSVMVVAALSGMAGCQYGTPGIHKIAGGSVIGSSSTSGTSTVVRPPEDRCTAVSVAAGMDLLVQWGELTETMGGVPLDLVAEDTGDSTQLPDFVWVKPVPLSPADAEASCADEDGLVEGEITDTIHSERGATQLTVPAADLPAEGLSVVIVLGSSNLGGVIDGLILAPVAPPAPTTVVF